MPGKSIPVYAACPTGHGAGNAVNGRVQIKTGFRNGARSNDARIPPGVVKGNVHIRHGTGGAAVGCRSNIQYAGILPAIEPVRINPVIHGSCCPLNWSWNKMLPPSNRLTCCPLREVFPSSPDFPDPPPHPDNNPHTVTGISNKTGNNFFIPGKMHNQKI